MLRVVMHLTARARQHSASGVSKQAKYTPSAQSGTRDMILERLSVLEGQGKVFRTDPTRAVN
jgi:hypothetical protein